MNQQNKFLLPKLDQRLSVVGHTGSGKTQFALWILSHAPLEKMPYVIIDYKRDGILNRIQKTRELDVTAKIPKKPGLYISHPLPHQESEIEDFLWNIWEKGNTGILVDEAHMLPNKGALQALLTQGRSKRIPMIVLTQRPVWTSRFVFSEADYIGGFWLNYPDDRKFVSGMMNCNYDPLPEYHSRYHSVKKHSTTLLKPVPEELALRERIESRLRPNTWFS